MSSSRPSRGRGRSAEARGRASGGNQTQTIGIVVGIVAIVVVAAALMMSGGNASDQPSKAGSTPPANQPAAAAPKSQPAQPAPSAGASARNGKTPTTPAPAIAAADLTAADGRYDRAAALWNEGQAARDAGDSKLFGDKLNEAFAEMEELYDHLRPYTDWYEEADLGGWTMPGEYVDLEVRLGRYDKLRQKVKKLMPRR